MKLSQLRTHNKERSKTASDNYNKFGPIDKRQILGFILYVMIITQIWVFYIFHRGLDNQMSRTFSTLGYKMLSFNTSFLSFFMVSTLGYLATCKCLKSKTSFQFFSLRNVWPTVFSLVMKQSRFYDGIFHTTEAHAICTWMYTGPGTLSISNRTCCVRK